MTRLRVLDFDIENRPLSYLGQDYTTAEITAIAWCWVGAPKTLECVLLGRESPVEMLELFGEAYDEADVVTGHFLRMHDLPIINGAMVEHGLVCLAPKLTCDTKLDLVKHGHVISASQENLAETLGVTKPKIHMNTPRWREANRLTDAGLALTAKRVMGDVVQHMALRKRLIELDLLKPPKTWRP
jgi:hypothetical protein